MHENNLFVRALPLNSFLSPLVDRKLPIIEKGKRKLVEIKEGELFVLPPRIPHSPQRPETGSVGLVIERERVEGEIDCLRWYTDFEVRIMPFNFLARRMLPCRAFSSIKSTTYIANLFNKHIWFDAAPSHIHATRPCSSDIFPARI